MKLIILLLLLGIAPAFYVFYLLRQFFQIGWAFNKANRQMICPACHRFVKLRHFQCDKCGTVHDLTPSEAEIFHTICSCGQKLPKVPQDGRDRLVAICSHEDCHYALGTNAGKYPEVIIPIIGGTSTGKSAFLAAWTLYLQNQFPFRYKARVSFPFPGGPEYVDQCRKFFSAGITPRKTSITNPHGLGMEIVFRRNQKGLRVYLYDPAGEVFDYNPTSLSPFHYYDYMDGAIFLIDPFSIPMLQKKYAMHLKNTTDFQVFDRRIGDYCEKFIRGLYAHNLTQKQYHHASCAVVITKSDAFDLDNLIGKAATEREMAGDPRLSFEEVMDDICSRQLKEWGMGHVLRLLKEHFTEIRCFSVSALGHMPKPGKPFSPQCVEMPLLWLLENNEYFQKT